MKKVMNCLYYYQPHVIALDLKGGQSLIEVSEDGACVLSYMVAIVDEPITSAECSPEMIRRSFLIAGIEVTIEHVMHVQESLWKKDLLDRRTTTDGVRFRISPKGIRFCKRNGITPYGS